MKSKNRSHSKEDTIIQPKGVQPSLRKKLEDNILEEDYSIKNNSNMMLPPQMTGPTLGRLFVETGKLEDLTYNSRDYSKQEESEIYANIKFWGEQGNGIFLKFFNKMGSSESCTNKYMYEVKCPEKVFERYLDDMCVLTVSFWDAKRHETVGLTRIPLKLYIRRGKNQTGQLLPLLEI